MAMPETLYATGSDGVHIAYQVTGDGDLDLVLMHGAVAHLEMGWEDPKLRRVYERLGAFTRLIRFDRRGMGMSDGLSELPTFDQQVEDWATVMEAVGSQRAALMGAIDAGTLALAFAAEHPERASCVVAFETAPRYARSGEDDYGLEPEMLGRLATANREVDTRAAVSIVAPDRLDEPGFLRWFRRYSRAASSGFQMEAFARSIMTWDITDRLSRIEMPVLVLHKTGHTILPIRNGRALAAALPDARLVELPGTGTTIFSNDVDEIADEIEGFLTGTRPPPRRDRVLATVLFTDVVGSTQRATELGDRDWRALLERHHQLLRAELERFGGHEVHTAGDGFLATFDSPRLAVECARAAGESIRMIGLAIRSGVHTGEVELSDGDVQGLAVHIGARIGALAGPNEVLVSSTVKDLVTGSGIEFADRGDQELRGVPGTWHVYEVM
jgi:class 3 adenylate cyclase